MFTINKWKLALIVGVFVLFGLYLLPTPSSLYGPIYGYFDIWMQGKIPRPMVMSESQEEGNPEQKATAEPQGETPQPVATNTSSSILTFNLQGVELPKGINFQEATNRLEIILRGRLESLGLDEISKEQLQEQTLGANQYSFDIIEQKEFLVKFGQPVDAVKQLVNELQLYASLPLGLRRIFPDNRINLGLDLSGGVYLVLELDEIETKEALLLERKRYIKERMRSERINVREVEWQPGKDVLIVSVNIPQRLSAERERMDYLTKAEEILKELGFFDAPEIKEDSEDKRIYSIRLNESGLKKESERAIDQVYEVLDNRIDAFGVAEPEIRKDTSKPRIIIQLPGAKDSSQALGIVKTMGRLEFKLVKQAQPRNGNTSGFRDVPPPDDVPENCEIRYGIDDEWYMLEKEVLLTGEHIKNAGFRQEQNMIQYIVTMGFDRQGGRIFEDITGAHVNERLAILLDGIVQSAPNIKQKISGGSAQIEGDFTADEANYLGKILRAGAFPVGVRVAEERTVGPKLGQEAINRGVWAATLGMGLVVILIVFYYRLSGLIAVAALIFNMEIILGALAGLGATLTLPGLAGLVLTIGIAIDANVLIFERIREELKTGKTVRSAIDTGYRRAFLVILDANVTTLLIALVLLQFGTGPIKGFAITLSIGILASMFTALVMTKEMYSWIYQGRKIEKLSI